MLLLDPNAENAAHLASLLSAEGLDVLICEDAGSALPAVEKTFFFALIVVADLTNMDCLMTLETLRRRAPRSWMIVAAPDCDVHACNHIYRHGGDACVAMPISLDDLVHRLDAFCKCTRPSF